MVQRDYTQQNTSSEFQFEITEKIAVLDRGRNKWTVELNRVSFNGGDPKLDLRSWSPEGRMGKGIVLNEQVAKNLFLALADYYGDKLNETEAETPVLEASYPNDFNSLAEQVDNEQAEG